MAVFLSFSELLRVSLRGDVNVTLNRLIAQGAITGFRTNFGSEAQVGLHVVVTAAPDADRDDVRRLVTSALEKLVETPTVTVDQTGPAA